MLGIDGSTFGASGDFERMIPFVKIALTPVCDSAEGFTELLVYANRPGRRRDAGSKTSGEGAGLWGNGREEGWQRRRGGVKEEGEYWGERGGGCVGPRE